MEHAEHAAGGHRHYTEMQDMRNMGGLFAHMPWTARTFIVATIAIAGIPPLAGFVSKDEILWRATGGGHVTPLWIVAALAAGMTAFYMTRQVILTFFGKFRGGEKMEHHLHEAPPVMWVPLVVLAVGSIFAGFRRLAPFPWRAQPHRIVPRAGHHGRDPSGGGSRRARSERRPRVDVHADLRRDRGRGNLPRLPDVLDEREGR